MNRRLASQKIGLFSALFLLLGCSALTTQRIDDAVIHAWQGNEPLPLAHRIDETLTIERAYAIQTRSVRRVLADEKPVGFKAGLTSKLAQARFSADGPIAGVLLKAPSSTPRELKLSELRGLHIETEVAMRVGEPIHRRLTSVDELRSHIDGVAPAVELPNLDYQDANELHALDIVATNVAAAYFLLGEFAPPQQRDANALSASLACNGGEMSRGNAREALGDQWTAALWLVNTMLDQGWTIERGQVLLTGALGKMVRAQPGRCTADFGSWGRIELRLVP
jgi:2-keto-4-pentenoate hydratase